MVAKGQAPAYTREELLANAATLFDVQPEVLKGALHSSDKETFSVDQARSALDKFLRKKVN